MASSATELRTGAVFHGRYEVLRVLGEGGMGTVYEVLDRVTERRRALKVMLPGLSSNGELRKRFQREATVAARIQSEHVAETLDAGLDEASGALYIVLELLEGRPLDAVLEQQGPLDPDAVISVLRQAASAIDKAHAAGVVHRDLKPANLFVTARDDGSPKIKLLDFGIAKVISATCSGSETQGMLGTPLYMAPEQVDQEVKIGPRTDLYALGHIAYALLTAEPYFRVEQQASGGIYPFIMKLVRGPQESPRARAAARQGVTLPEAFDRWFLRAVALDPSERFESAAELVGELATVLGVTLDAGVSRPIPALTQHPRRDQTLASSGVSAPSADRSEPTAAPVQSTLSGRGSPGPLSLVGGLFAGVASIGLIIFAVRRAQAPDGVPLGDGASPPGASDLAPIVAPISAAPSAAKAAPAEPLATPGPATTTAATPTAAASDGGAPSAHSSAPLPPRASPPAATTRPQPPTTAGHVAPTTGPALPQTR